MFLNYLSICTVLGRGGGGEGEVSHKKGAGMLVGIFELNPKGGPIWAWPDLFLLPLKGPF